MSWLDKLASDAGIDPRERLNMAAQDALSTNEDEGIFSQSARLLLGGVEGFGSGVLKTGGAFAHYLDDMNASSRYGSVIHDQKDRVLNQLGDWMINNGQYLGNEAAKIHATSGSGDAFQDRSLSDLLTDPNYVFNRHGLYADMVEGTGSTLPFFAINYLVPGSGFVTKALSKAGSIKKIAPLLAKTPEAAKAVDYLLASPTGRS